MTIAELVYIRNEIKLAEERLSWSKGEGYMYGSRESAERAIKRCENRLWFWKNELK